MDAIISRFSELVAPLVALGLGFLVSEWPLCFALRDWALEVMRLQTESPDAAIQGLGFRV